MYAFIVIYSFISQEQRCHSSFDGPNYSEWKEVVFLYLRCAYLVELSNQQLSIYSDSTFVLYCKSLMLCLRSVSPNCRICYWSLHCLAISPCVFTMHFYQYLFLKWYFLFANIDVCVYHLSKEQLFLLQVKRVKYDLN